MKLTLLVIALGSFGASAASLNTLRDLEVRSTAAGAEVAVKGDRPPTFTVFRLSDPDRLVIDLSSTDATGVKGHYDGTGPITGVVASQFSDAKASVGRILVTLERATQYDVRADGNRVVVAVSREGAAAPVVAAAPAAAPRASVPAAAVAAADAAVEAPPAVADEKKVADPARSLTGIAFNGETLRVTADGDLERFEVLELENPPRLVVDVHGVTLDAKVPRKVRSAHLKELRAGAHPDKVRLVLDMKGAMPAYRAMRSEKGLRVSLSAHASPAVAEAEVAAEDSQEAEVLIDGKPVALQPGTEAAPLKAPPAANGPLVKIEGLTFDDAPTGGKVELKLSGSAQYKVERPDARSAVLTLDRASLPKQLEQSLDTSALDTPVKMISAFAVPGAGQKVRVVVAAAGGLEESVVRAGGLTWKLKIAGVKTEAAASAANTAGFTSEATRFAEAGAPQRSKYQGKKVSFEFKDIDIHNLLRIIAEVSKRNIVVADDVKGTVTIRLRNVPWDQALELILRSKGLGKEDLGTIVRVAPLRVLEEESSLRAKRAESMKKQEELAVQLVPVNYATANEMSQRVKDVLSERGAVSVDSRTNTLIIRDVASNIARARSLVASLDTQTPQVLIESRIVEANTTFSRQLGVQWGGLAQAAPGTGNATGLVFPNTVSVRGGSTSDPNEGTSGTPNYAVNLPAGVGTGAGGALGFVFGSAGGSLALNLRLSALESEGTVKTISAPKVTTLDNNAATISQGVSIPFSQVSAGGANTSFVEARLSLSVTPHITQDGSVLMAISAQNNQPDTAATGANGQPAIQRKEATTQVLVKDGDTTVIGGIYVRRGGQSTALVPFFGRLPILGLLFKNHQESENRQELLIFITPRIINRQTIAQQM
jgi:type IV pilus assembly protein PilQ